MGSYQIRAGDTLSQLASRFGTSVDALVRSNSQIQNADLIYTGDTLQIPGATDGFDDSGARRASGTGSVGAPSGSSGTPSMGPGGSPYEIAQSHLGKNASSLKLEGNGVGAFMEDWVPNNVNCANFVSGVLRQAGQIDAGQQSASVMNLMGNLDGDSNFSRVSLANAQPGDVVSMKTPGGQHVVLFAGFENGQPRFIGSNNINADGSQQVSYANFNYPIMAVHHYNG